MTPEQVDVGVDSKITARLVVHRNIDQEVVMASVDKMKNTLNEHWADLTAQTNWLAPAGLLVTLATTVVSATFNSKPFSPEEWKLLYELGVVGTSIWTLRAVFNALKLRGRNTVESIISDLKGKQS
jgi:hypothetical protein